MNNEWRHKAIAVTKYDPKYYHEEGYYTKDEWTSISDVGTTYDGVVFTREDYNQTEEAYISAVNIFMNFAGSREAEIFEYNKKLAFLNECKNDAPELYGLCKRFRNELVIRDEEIAIAVKLILREFLHANLIIDLETKSYIYFGYDYYMYFVTNKDIMQIKEQIEATGLSFRYR